jgi:hypothetical protein
MEPTKAFPIFERRLWREDEGDQSILSIPKQFLESRCSTYRRSFSDHQLNYDHVNLYFFGEQFEY